jgi:hypothetical protein
MKNMHDFRKFGMIKYLFIFILISTTFIENALLRPGDGYDVNTVFDFKNYIANIDQPFGSTVADAALAKKQYDVLLTGAPNNIRFIEFKSCKGTDTESIIETKKVDIPKNAQFVDQFLAYLSDSRLTNLNGLLYVFNKKKTTTLESAKLIMQGVFKRNAMKIWDARPSFFNFQYNGAVLTKNTFQEFVDNIDVSHPIFNFIVIN